MLDQGGKDSRYRLVVENMVEYAVVTTDPDGRVETWNAGAERLFGYSEAEMVGQSAERLFPPEEIAAGKFQTELRAVATTGRADDEGWLVRRDDTRFWGSGVMVRLDGPEGQLLGFSKVVRDYTVEKEAFERLRDAEERLRAALRAAHMGTWRFHAPSNTQRVDSSMARLLGLGESEVIETYQQFQEHIHPEDRDKADAAFGNGLQGGEMDVEFRVVWPDGTVRWLQDHGQAIHPADQSEYLTGAAVDVTERKLAEERLVQAQRMDAVGQLAGGGGTRDQ